MSHPVLPGFFGEALDACLLSDAELADGHRAWASLADPIPQWEMEGSSASH